MYIDRDLYTRVKQFKAQGFDLSERREAITSIEEFISVFPSKSSEHMRERLYKPQEDLKEFLLSGYKAIRSLDYVAGATWAGLGCMGANASFEAYADASYGSMVAYALLSTLAAWKAGSAIYRIIRSAQMTEKLEEREF